MSQHRSSKAFNFRKIDSKKFTSLNVLVTFFSVLVAYGKQLLLATSWVTQQLRGIELSVASNLRTRSRVNVFPRTITSFWNGSGLFVPPDLIEISVVRWIMWDRKDFVILTSNARGARRSTVIFNTHGWLSPGDHISISHTAAAGLTLLR